MFTIMHNFSRNIGREFRVVVTAESLIEIDKFDYLGFEYLF